MYPENAMLHEIGEESRLIVSEPLGGLEGAWNEVPESVWGSFAQAPMTFSRSSRALPR